MKFQIYLNSQVLPLQGQPTLEELINHVNLYLEELPKKSFELSYIDEEGDRIALASEDDMTAMYQSMNQFPETPIFINSLDELKFKEAWVCSMCTFLNDTSADKCEICITKKSEKCETQLVANPKQIKSCIKGEKKICEEEKPNKSAQQQQQDQLLLNVQEILNPIMEPLLDCKIERVEIENPPQDTFKLQEQLKPILSMGKTFGNMFKEAFTQKKQECQEKKKALCKKVQKAKVEKKQAVVNVQSKVNNKQAQLSQSNFKSAEEKLSVFQSIEKNFERISKDFAEGNIDAKQFNAEWNNEALTLKKRVQTMKAAAIKQQEEKVKSATVSEMEKKKAELEKQIQQLSKEISTKKQIEDELKKVEEAKKIQQQAQKQVQAPVKQQKQKVNNLKPLQNYQQVEKNFEQKLQDMVSIFGGSPCDYEQYLVIYPDASIEDLVDMISQVKQAERERLEDQLFC